MQAACYISGCVLHFRLRATFQADCYIPGCVLHSRLRATFQAACYISGCVLHFRLRATFQAACYIPGCVRHSRLCATFQAACYISGWVLHSGCVLHFRLSATFQAACYIPRLAMAKMSGLNEPLRSSAIFIHTILACLYLKARKPNFLRDFLSNERVSGNTCSQNQRLSLAALTHQATHRWTVVGKIFCTNLASVRLLNIALLVWELEIPVSQTSFLHIIVCCWTHNQMLGSFLTAKVNEYDALEVDFTPTRMLGPFLTAIVNEYDAIEVNFTHSPVSSPHRSPHPRCPCCLLLQLSSAGCYCSRESLNCQWEQDIRQSTALQWIIIRIYGRSGKTVSAAQHCVGEDENKAVRKPAVRHFTAGKTKYWRAKHSELYSTACHSVIEKTRVHDSTTATH